ncbi:male accessory gland serine protease inhibitor-like [Drosophila innubila]|uniref:male accessory gland serine protease inhibitor-like n=1 Tax=Drosophila innubila TaxID=198719 RepID=UPI00148BA78A|nr:male accessory gland serine protease inhibitor-like [Drosophila innubila]
MSLKLFILFVVFFAFIASSLAFKNPECGEPHSKNGVEAPNGRIMVCMAKSTRWSYDAEANKCVSFNYGGCGGNRNSFGSLQQCEATCLE